MKKLTKAQIILSRLAILYNSECVITGKPFAVKGFTIHHMRYLKDKYGKIIEKKRTDFPYTQKGRDDYYEYLEPLVMKDPGRFVLITNGIHTRLDHKIRGLTRLKKQTLIRLFIISYLSEK